ncbi:hypothetical protein G7K71_13610 [Desulfofundulus sp. TPOSR]|uniref:hypothetical protein n=1 Tax=Desulfofundulus sp. TPOSR TaxID=2714340 RepID=UPI00140AAA60|nr:hypothetical protein [Desulfofundulus sp. TPOSR]NHM27995.1 hypothetical protein [Desulfofundulus sp. TPOSR]
MSWVIVNIMYGIMSFILLNKLQRQKHRLLVVMLVNFVLVIVGAGYLMLMLSRENVATLLMSCKLNLYEFTMLPVILSASVLGPVLFTLRSFLESEVKRR